MAGLDYGWTLPSVPHVFKWAKGIGNVMVGLSGQHSHCATGTQGALLPSH